MGKLLFFAILLSSFASHASCTVSGAKEKIKPELQAAMKKASSADPAICQGINSLNSNCKCDEKPSWALLDGKCLKKLDEYAADKCGKALTPSIKPVKASPDRTDNANKFSGALNSSVRAFHDEKVKPCTEFLFSIIPKCIDLVLKVVEVIDTCKSPKRAKEIMVKLKDLKKYKSIYIGMCNRAAESATTIGQMISGAKKSYKNGQQTGN